MLNTDSNQQEDEEQKILDQAGLNSSINNNSNNKRNTINSKNINNGNSGGNGRQSPQLLDDREMIKKQQKEDIQQLLGRKNQADQQQQQFDKLQRPADEFDDLLEDSLDLDNFGRGNGGSKINGNNNSNAVLSPIKAINNNSAAKNSDMKSKKLEDLFGIESKSKPINNNNNNNISVVDDKQQSESKLIKNNNGSNHKPVRESEDDFDKLIGHIEGSRAVNGLRDSTNSY